MLNEMWLTCCAVVTEACTSVWCWLCYWPAPLCPAGQQWWRAHQSPRWGWSWLGSALGDPGEQNTYIWIAKNTWRNFCVISAFLFHCFSRGETFYQLCLGRFVKHIQTLDWDVDMRLIVLFCFCPFLQGIFVLSPAFNCVTSHFITMFA